MLGMRLAIKAIVAALVIGSGVSASSLAQNGKGDMATIAPLAAKHLLISVTKIGSRLVTVGEHGHVLLSDDLGKAWEQQAQVPTRVTLTDVSFSSDQVGWAVGHDTVILKTEDAGKTWVKQFGGVDSDDALLTVVATGPQSAMAFGAFSYATRTTDGGRTWQKFSLIEGSQDDFHLQSAFLGPNNSVYVAAEFGTVYRSRDGGATWEKITTGYEGSFWSGAALKDGSLVIVGMRGNIWRSTDQGTTWTKVQADLRESLSSVTQLADGTVVTVGLGGAIGVSKDGLSYAAVYHRERKGFAGVIEGQPGRMLVVGEPGVLDCAVPQGNEGEISCLGE
jgi:photosystem II stability/assembly factor-like uncharacterized protein